MSVSRDKEVTLIITLLTCDCMCAHLCVSLCMCLPIKKPPKQQRRERNKRKMKEKSLGTQFKTLVKHISDFQYLSLLSMTMAHSATRLQSQTGDLPLGAATRKKIADFNHWQNWHKPHSES